MRYISLSTIFTIIYIYFFLLKINILYCHLKKGKTGGSWLAKGNPGNRKGLSWLKCHIGSWGEPGTQVVSGNIDLISHTHSHTDTHTHMHTHSLSVSVSGESHEQVSTLCQERFLTGRLCFPNCAPQGTPGCRRERTEVMVFLNIFEGSPTIPGICQTLVGPLPQQDQC